MDESDFAVNFLWIYHCPKTRWSEKEHGGVYASKMTSQIKGITVMYSKCTSYCRHFLLVMRFGGHNTNQASKQQMFLGMHRN